MNSGPGRSSSRWLPRAGIGLEGVDHHRWWTWLSWVGMALAVILVAIGGLPFDLPMPTHQFGWVEPTCGLTRGSTAIARGDLALAWRYNPASFIVIGFGLLGVCRSVAGMVTGRWVRVSCRPGTAGGVLVVLAVAALWAHQQANAQFVMASVS